MANESETFERYSSMFILDQENIPNHRLHSCLRIIEDEMKEPIPFEEEVTINFNYISGLKWMLGDKKGAEEFCDKALEHDRSNLTALANKAYMFHKKFENANCVETCNDIERIAKDRFLELVAKAEIAFCFSRFGTHLYQRCSDILEEVLKEIHDKEMMNETRKPYVILINFVIGLCNVRHLNFSNLPEVESQMSFNNRIEKAARAFNSLLEINVNKTYAGRAYVLLGEMKKLNFLETRSNDAVPLSMKEISQEEYYHKALENAESDVFVLERCGKYFRHSGKYERAEKCFREAISLRPTSFSHHHLGLVLRQKLFLKRNSRKKTYVRESVNADSNMYLKYIRKSPRRVCKINVSEETDDIMQHFSKAIKMGNTAAAKYDMGLFLRSLNQLELAKEQFVELCNDQETTEMYTVNSFEQIAFCLLQTNKRDRLTIGEEKKKKNESDARRLLLNAVRLIARIIRRRPNLDGSWTGISEFRLLLKKVPKTVQYFKELGVASEMLGEYYEVLNCCQSIICMTEDEAGGFEQYTKMIDINMKLHKYNEASMLQDMICFKDPNFDFKHAQYIEAHVLGGFECLNHENETKMAQELLKSALDFKLCITEEPDTTDIYFHCQESVQNLTVPLCKFLKEKLGMTLVDHVPPNQPELLWIGKALLRSKHFVIVANDEQFLDEYKSGMVLDEQVNSQWNRRLLVLKHPDTDMTLPARFRSFPMESLPTATSPQELSEQAKVILLKLLQPLA